MSNKKPATSATAEAPPLDALLEADDENVAITPIDKDGKIKPEDRVIPQVRVINEYGKTERKKRAIDLNISEMLLPPFTRKSTATYKLIPSWYDPSKSEREQMNVKVIDPATNQPPEPRDLSIPGTYVLVDKGEKDPTKRQKTMINPGRDQIVTDKNDNKYLKQEILDVEFVADFCHVNVEDNYMLYVFMELHPSNASNKFRPNKTARPIFMRVDIYNNKSQEFRILEQDLSYEAEKIIVETKEKDKIIAWAATTGTITTTNKQVGEIKADLRIWARNNPKEFFKFHGDVTPAIKLNVLDAQGLGLIEFDPNTKCYIEMDSGQQIHQVMVGEDPLDSLVKRLKKEPEKYKLIRDMLDYWE